MAYKLIISFIIIQFISAEFVPFGGELYFDSKNAQNMGIGGYSASFSVGANPAKLLQSDTPSLSFSHKNKYMGLSSMTTASYLFNYELANKKIPIYIALINRIVDNIPDTRLAKEVGGSINYQKISYFSQKEIALALASSYTFNKLNVGLTFKPLYTNIADYRSYSISSDLGIQKNYFDQKIEIGLRIENIISINYWNTGSVENNYPYLMTNFQINLNSLLLGLEFGSYIDNYYQINYHTGFEYTHEDIFFIRCGVSDNLFSSGLGIKVNSLKLDYALLYSIGDNPFSNSQIISIGISFSEFFELKDKFSP